jgi:hypothetical protein
MIFVSAIDSKKYFYDDYSSDWQREEVLQLVISNLDQKELYFLSALLMVR